jgi:hypothetical protein
MLPLVLLLSSYSSGTVSPLFFNYDYTLMSMPVLLADLLLELTQASFLLQAETRLRDALSQLTLASCCLPLCNLPFTPDQ